MADSTDVPFNYDALNSEQLRQMAHTLIYEGYLQAADLENVTRIKSRWQLRATTEQVSVRDLKGRAGNNPS